MTIKEFVEARIAEDEAISRAASRQSAEWRVYEGCVRGGPFYEGDPEGGYPAGGETTIVAYDGTPFEVEAQQSRHIARHDPARVLRQAGVLRALVAGHDRDEWFEFDDETTGSCKACSNYCPECRSLVRWPCNTLRMVAGIWHNHPDYQPEYGRRSRRGSAA